MKIIRLLGLLVVIAVMATGCNKDESGSLDLVFRGVYGGEPLVMYRDYDYAFGDTILFSKSDFYLTKVRLVSSSGSEELLDVELVDLSFANEADARDGFVIPLGDVEARSYDRLDFFIGLTPEMNAGRPEDYPSSNPLSLPRYWEPWNSYIFAEMEGSLDTLGGSDSNLGWAYHTGTDAMTAELRISSTEPIKVVDGKTTRIEVTMDMRTVLGVGIDPIDIKRKPQNHNPTDTIELRKIVENYPVSMTVQW